MKYDLRTENEIPPFNFPFHSQAIGNFIRRLSGQALWTIDKHYSVHTDNRIFDNEAYNEEQRITTW